MKHDIFKPLTWALSVFIIIMVSSVASAAPDFPGLANKHPLTEKHVGRLLMNELQCAACHAGITAPKIDAYAAPDLREVGSRVSPEYLKSFILSPSTAHRGSKMPDLLAAEPVEKREAIAEAISQFLIAQSQGVFTFEAVNPDESTAGQKLFHTVGCVTCHAPRDEKGAEIARDSAISLVHLPRKYSQASLSQFLLYPTRVRPAGRMPDMKLNPAESRAIASYLLGSAAKKVAALTPDGAKVAIGQREFQRLNCSACHQLSQVPDAKPMPKQPIGDTSGGCLSEKPEHAPRFSLSPAQIKAIQAALKEKTDAVTDKEQLALTLTAFNCIGCHKRETYGGVVEEINEYFTSTEKELGDEGRIPPPLTHVGAKLRPIIMKKVLFDGDSVRTYMHTRMPQFGEKNLSHLTELFSQLDSLPPVSFRLPKPEGRDQKERDREKEMRTAGRELVGDKGLYCIACHGMNGKSPLKAGIDMVTFTARLQPNWFYHFVRDPGAFRPRTIMPSSWSKGIASHQTILNGDSDRQIEAIWYYFSLGTSAQPPSGVLPVESLLSATDAPRTYRGRSTVAGFRGIAVGFPEKLHYAFNAETGTLTAIWSGDFIRVNRSGQGSGNFQPAARAVQLAQDLSFCELPNDKAPWPLRPVMTKDAPVNPDPLYPKNRGYQFLGYEWDDTQIPTFHYRSSDVDIHDRSVVRIVNNKPVLVRTLTFETAKDRTLWFRALTGPIEAKEKSRYQIKGLRLTAPDVGTMLRPMPESPKETELLLRLELPKGQSSYSITYELLP